MTNKYLEKIAKMNSMSVVRTASDVNTVRKLVSTKKKKKKKKVTPSATASRRFNRGPVRKG